MTISHTIEEYEKALRDSKGMVSVAARMLGVTQQAVSYRVKTSTTLQRVRDEAREAMTDVAELRLYERIQAGEGWAVCFYLKTQGRSRGYIERTEFANAPGEDFRVEVRPADYRTGLQRFLPPADEDING
jgi:predicted transcriptional regulator